MESIAGAAGLLFVGAITPGPNNLIVMHAAATRGWRAVGGLVAGIVLGGVALLIPAVGGVGSLVNARPDAALYIAAAGCAVLVALGVGMITADPRSKPATRARTESRSVRAWHVFVLQFLNPKAWVLVVTLASATQSVHGVRASLLLLVPLFVVIPTACLCLWSAVGVVMMRRLERVSARQLFNRTLGVLLCASAVLLFVGQVLEA